MPDLIIVGGVVIDGTGAPSRRADVSIENGRVLEIGEPGSIVGAGAKRINVDGRVVAPGFIDIHTHLDAQVFWDPACTPVPFHGVTTVIAGNCGFSVAPLGSGSDDADYVIRMLARVEEIPIESLRTGVPWNWSTMGEYLDRVEGIRPAINMGFMAGHSTLRRAVMGPSAVGEESSPQQIDQMAELLRRSLGDGALGLSTSLHWDHFDGEGKRVPSCSASNEELIALAGVVGEFPGTQLEMIGYRDASGHSARSAELMIRMSLAAGRKLNWNVFRPDASDKTEKLLALSDEAAKRGANVYALGYPGLGDGVRYFQRMGLPGWTEFNEISHEERMRCLSDPVERTRLAERIAVFEQTRPLGLQIDFARMVLFEGFTDETRAFEGRPLGEIAEDQGCSSWDVLCDVVVADNLRSRFYRSMSFDSRDDWEARKASWCDPRVILGGSDAGAHVNSVAAWSWATDFLFLNREHEAMSLEAAVHRVSGRHADFYGIIDRGRIAEGCFADITVFDPAVIGPGSIHTVRDLPGGASRLTSQADGITHVFVNGAEIVRDGHLLEARKGQVLRSGHATETVPLFG